MCIYSISFHCLFVTGVCLSCSVESVKRFPVQEMYALFIFQLWRTCSWENFSYGYTIILSNFGILFFVISKCYSDLMFILPTSRYFIMPSFLTIDLMSALCLSICCNCPLAGDTSAFVGQRMTVIVRALCQFKLCLLTIPHPWVKKTWM